VIRRLFRRVRAALGSTASERDLRDELQFHLDRQIEDLVRDGMPPHEARAAALRAFGGVEQAKEACRDARTREIGVRMTLGAPPADVIRMVMGRGLKMVLLGIAAGAGAALLLGRGIEGLLFGIRADDPPTFLAVVVLLTLVAAVASYLPARRAAGVDLISALRQD